LFAIFTWHVLELALALVPQLLLLAAAADAATPSHDNSVPAARLAAAAAAAATPWMLRDSQLASHLIALAAAA